MKQAPVLPTDDVHSGEPPAKKRRLSDENEIVAKPKETRIVFKQPGISSLPRKPLESVKNPNLSADSSSQTNGADVTYYNVLW